MAELNLSDLCGVDVVTHRFDQAVVVDVSWPEGRETFFVAAGQRSLGVMAFEPGDASFAEPRLYLVPKPAWVDLDASHEDLLLLIWQVLGGQR